MIPAMAQSTARAPRLSTRLLEHPRIVLLHAAAETAQLAAQRTTLLAGIDPSIQNSLPTAPTPAAHLLSDLGTLNALGQLPDGTAPLAYWLVNAHRLSKGRVEADVFQEAIDALPPECIPPSLRSPAGKRGLRGKLAYLVAALAAICALAMLGAARWRRAPPPPIPAGARVVLAGAWLASEDGNALCREVKALIPSPGVQCFANPLSDEDESALLGAAANTGVAVLASIEAKGSGHVHALGAIERDELLGGAWDIDMARAADRRRIAVLLDVLARLAAPLPGLAPKDIACPLGEHEPIDRLALLALLAVPQCKSTSIDRERLLEPCAGTTEADETCALAAFLDVRRCKKCPTTRDALERLRDHGPRRFQVSAAVTLARMECASSPGDATRAILRLDTTATSCLRVALSEIAACVVVSSSDPPAPTEIINLAAFPIADRSECPADMRARSLGLRAQQWGRGHRWPEATADFGAAFGLAHDPLYALNQAEAMLHQGAVGRAREVLDGTPEPADGRDRFYAALLRWIAARDQGPPHPRDEASALAQLYDALEVGTPALRPDADDDLRALTCAAPTPGECMFDELRSPKREGSSARLRRMLKLEPTPK